MSRTSVVLWVSGILLVLIGIYLFTVIRSAIMIISYALSPPDLQPYEPAGQQEFIEQNCTAEQSEWFHHVSKGTATLPIPYRWLVALEQPASSPWLIFLVI